MLEVAILLTVFNRKEKTLACLQNCFRQIDAMKSDGNYSFSVYMVDDGSTDGTSEAVRHEFPLTRIIRGDGGLYWNQGMRTAWQSAANSDCDFYLWLNDDTIMKDGALAVLLESSEFFRHKAILVGTTVDNEGLYSYGGRTKGGKIVEPDPTIPLPCYTFNGNLVLVPRAAYNVLGMLDIRYSHSFGDYDYGVRAVKAGIPRAIAPGVLAYCDRNPGVPKWRDAKYTLQERYRFFISPKGRPPKEQFLYDTRSIGFFNAIGHLISLMLKVLFPVKSK